MIISLQMLSTGIKRMVNSVFAVIRWIGRSLPPKTLCVACLEPTADDGICGACQSAMPVNSNACQQCALPLPAALMNTASGSPHTRPRCGPCLHRTPAFDRTIAPWRYEFPVSGLIGRFKYGGQRAYGRPMANTMARAIANRPEPLPHMLIPVPMHPRKQRRRGFNQAEEIAHWLTAQLGVPTQRHLLSRTRHAEAQSTLRRRQRLKNLKGAFTVLDRVPPHVALIDDVMTTGATAGELARLLKKNGAQRVEVWVLARTPVARLHQ